MFAEAVRQGASDIHVEPQRDDLRIRYRVDGLLREVMTVPKKVTAALGSRIKVMSGLDIAERRKPQDGRARLQVDDLIIDARISTLPTVHGEKVVIRLLSRGDNVAELGGVGPRAAASSRRCSPASIAPQGLVLITGPTGSGKTNTLYSAIQQIRSAARNIVTLEDPVEISLTGINQVQVNERTGMTFARGLRAVLRQDPDIVLVGEVRDLETADLALQASLTGHLVLTTLHTNDAVSAVTRLVDMGSEPFLVASSLTMVVAQRLVRKPCQSCAAPYFPRPRTLELLGLGSRRPRRRHARCMGVGCADCGETGYRGRTARVRGAADHRCGAPRAALDADRAGSACRGARSAGMLPLRAAGLAKAARGETTYEEVLRVTHVDAGDGRACRLLRARGRRGHGRLPVVRDGHRPRPLRLLQPTAGARVAGLPLVPDPGGVTPRRAAGPRCLGIPTKCPNPDNTTTRSEPSDRVPVPSAAGIHHGAGRDRGT